LRALCAEFLGSQGGLKFNRFQANLRVERIKEKSYAHTRLPALLEKREEMVREKEEEDKTLFLFPCTLIYLL